MSSLEAATLVYSTAGKLFHLFQHYYINHHLRYRENTSPLVTGVSHAVFSRVASMTEGHARMNMAITSTFALYLT
jgi:membrane protein insertase Oxa1/YidC/SpoIIIJ